MFSSNHLRVTAASVVIVALFAYPVAAAPTAQSTAGPAPEPGNNPCSNCTLFPTGPPDGSAGLARISSVPSDSEIYYQLTVRA